jgi:hypothetical protein
MFEPEPLLPNVPSNFYIGTDRDRQMRVFPVPPDDHSQPYFPYSTRSFVYQASREFGGCAFNSHKHGDTMTGEPVFTDSCRDPMDDFGESTTKCHILSGWTRGRNTCDLWGSIAALCQTDAERNFLHQYLRFVKGRVFPMLIPQVRIGIGERRRSDFMLFAPLQSLKYERYVIELDGTHTGSDEERNRELERWGYTVHSLRPGARGYFEEVQRLVEFIEYDMDHVEEEDGAFDVAVVRKVRSYESALPF